MIRFPAFAIAALLLTAAVPAPQQVLDPAAAIQLADSEKDHDHAGVFRMTVASAGVKRRITFLDSEADYRAPGNVSFSLSESVARQLAERLGGPVTSVAVGKTVVVSGALQRRAIVNYGADGKPLGFNRWGYNVEIRKIEQVVSITP